MKTIGKGLWLTFILLFLAVSAVPASAAAPAAKNGAGNEGILVGRISHVEGQIMRYVPEEKDWVAMVKDTPFGFDDALYTGQDGKGEIILPNNTWERIGGETQLQMIALKPDVTEIDVASGIARFYNKSSNAVVKATTPFGYVTAQPGTSFDLYVGDKSVEIIALTGTVDFIHVAGNNKFEITAGSGSIVADSLRTAPGEGNVDADWDDWNVDRDKMWTQRLAVKGDSTEYLPSQLHGDAQTLEENGRWERVYYEGSYRNYWRPTTVDAGWSPYTVGTWSVYYDDNCWIPYEPFGYVTHHYGNWVYAGSYWYWAPPVVSVSIGPSVGWGWGFGWYPGRVSWIHSGGYVGWVPLAPYEPFYCHRYWGPGVVVAATLPGISINIGGFAYLGHAVVVPHNHFYGGYNYNSVRVTNINRTTIINNYNASPVVNNRVINNYNTNRNRFAVTNAAVTNRPMPTVVNRIQRNQEAFRNSAGLTARDVNRSVSTARAGTLQRTASVESPKLSSRLVPAGEAGRAGSAAGAAQARSLKTNTAAPKTSEGFMRNATAGQGSAGQKVMSNQAAGGQGTLQSPRADRRARSTAAVQQGQSVGRQGSTAAGTRGAISSTGKQGAVSTERQSVRSTNRSGEVSSPRSRMSTGTGSGQATVKSRTMDSGSRSRSLQSTGRTSGMSDSPKYRNYSTSGNVQRGTSRSGSQFNDRSRNARTSSSFERSSRGGSSSGMNSSRSLSSGRGGNSGGFQKGGGSQGHAPKQAGSHGGNQGGRNRGQQF
ncbi:MAG: FecR family protein [Desulfobacteraceae bacterium]|nr:FecR family protein [Desulfobacteraceae bacterium]